MSIFRSLVHWYVWWGRNAFYYYSRPFVWAWRFMRREDELVVAGRELNKVLQTEEESLRAQVAAFQSDVVAIGREYMRAMEEVERSEE